MKKLLPFLLIFFTSSFAYSQCSTCTPDYECIGADGLPAICPFEAPVAYTGEYYEHTLTVYIPAEVEDPGSGVTATLIEVTFLSATGLPYGLEFTLGDEDGIFHPSDGENHACATICGIPLLPGNYTVNITVNILATAFGFEVTQVQSFQYPLTVEPGEGGTASFTFDNPADCGGVETNFEATIVAPLPAVTTYSWDFGNGQTSTEQVPNTITYDSPGEYEVILTTTVANHTLSNISVSNLSGNWDGDVDDFFSPPADPYFTISDGSNQVIYTSSAANNTNSTSWDNLNFGLGNPPYNVQFFDSDDISDDDDLGTTTIMIDEGTNYFDIGNGTVGTMVITLVPTSVISDTTMITVFPFPDAQYIEGATSLYYDNPDLTTFLWYINGNPTENMTSSIDLQEGGQYYCVVTNEFGCTATSSTYLYCPEVMVQFDELAMEVYVDDIYETYQWYFNGLEVPNATLSYLTNVAEGNYAVEVTTSYGCSTMSEVYTYSSGIAGVEETRGLYVYPNPFNDMVSIVYENASHERHIRVFDLDGKKVFDQQQPYSEQCTFDLSSLAAGMYILETEGKRIPVVKR